MWGVGILAVIFLVFIMSTTPTPRAACPAHAQYDSRPIGPLERHPWRGQQHIEPTGRGDLFDVEYDRGHSGFLGNANYKAPPFIAGMTAMHQDF